MSKKLYIHIGLPKTGTTYLQCFLCHNSHYLSEEGLFYPDLATGELYNSLSGADKFNGNAYPLAYSYLDEPEITKCSITGIRISNLSKILGSTDKNVLLSSEWFTLLSPFVIRAIHKTALESDFSLQIICYIRRQDLYLESNYNQRIKSNRSYISFEDYFYAPDFFNQLGSFINILPDEIFTVRCLEKEQLHRGNLIDDFLSCAGIENIDKYKYPDKGINKSLSYGALNLLNEMNLHGFRSSPALDLLIRFLGELPSKKTHSTLKPGWLSPAQRNDLMNQVKGSNAEFADRFFESGKDCLFAEPLPNRDSAWTDARKQFLDHQDGELLLEKLIGRQEIANMKEIIIFIKRYLKESLPNA